MLTTTIKRLAPRGAPNETAYLPVASITVDDDGTVTLRGELRALPLGEALGDPKTRERVTLAEDPERWVRLLRFALRSPELQVTTEEHTTGPLDTTNDASPLAALRRALALTTRQAAAEIGVSQPAFSNAEKRGAGITLETLDRYTAALGSELQLQLRAPSVLVCWEPPGSMSRGRAGAVVNRAAHGGARHVAERLAAGGVRTIVEQAAGGARGRLEQIGSGDVTRRELEEISAKAHELANSAADPGSGGAYEVRPKARGEGWTVRRPGAKRASSSHDTRQAAIDAARAIAGVRDISVFDADDVVTERLEFDPVQPRRGGRA